MCNATPSRPTGSAEPAGAVTTAAPVEGPQGSPEWILTWVTALICALILLSVEQVRNVLLHLPTRHSFGDPWHVVLWYGLIALTILVGTWAWKLVALEGYFDSFEIKHRSRALIGTASIAMGIGLLALRRGESMSVNVIAMCFLIGGGLVLPTFLAEHPNMPKSVGGRLVLLLCVKAYAAYILWQLAANPDVEWVSYRAVTVWATFSGLFGAILLALYFDQCAWFRRFAWLRVLSLLAILASPLTFQPERVGRTIEPEPGTAWIQHFEERLDWIEDESQGPIILISASGGGSRSALFTAMTLDLLDGISSGQGRTARDNVLLISSVSGGSLASAHWSLAEDEERTWLNSEPEEIQGRIERIARGRPKSPPSVPVRPEGSKREWNLWELHAQAREWSSDRTVPLIDQVLEDRKAIAGGEADRLAGLLGSARVDDMCQDFMAPLLVWFPFGRGVGLTRAWDRMLTSVEPNLPRSSTLAPNPGQRPLLLLNTTNVSDGGRVVIGFPSLPPNLLDGSAHRYSLSHIDPTLDLSLAEGVRLSANFPWGLPVAHLRGTSGLRLVDGGVIDNTGLDTLRFLVAGLHDHSRRRTELGAACLRFWRLACKRGVLVVEINASASRVQEMAKPDENNVRKAPRDPFLYRQVLDPLRAVLRSQSLLQRRSRQHQIRTLMALLEKRPKHATLEDLDQPAAMRLLVDCYGIQGSRSEREVMTAWALGPDDKARVIELFLEQAQLIEDSLVELLK